MDVTINQQKIITFTADGLIVSSPTGSTGHSLSAGGPIVHPSIPGIVFNSICQPPLSVRPIVIQMTARSTLQLKPSVTASGLILVLPLMVETVSLQYEDEVKIRRVKPLFLPYSA